MNPFLRERRARAQMPAAKAVDGVATLRLYDPIDSWGGEWGVSAKEFVGQLDALGEVSEIRLLINSPGGEVWEGLAILNALRAHPAKVVAVVEGIAASSASFIAAGVDELHVMENADLFVHKAWGVTVGNADDMTKAATDLSHTDRNIASIYAAKSGGSVDDWLAVMSDDAFYSADEAVAARLADKKIPASGGGAKEARNRFDLSVFARAGGPTRADGISTVALASEPVHETEGDDMDPEFMAALAQRLGVTAPVDELDKDKLLAALDEALAEQAEEVEGVEPEPEKAEPGEVVVEGTVVVDKATLDALKADAAAGRAARDELDSRRREGVVDQAIRDGKITPANRAKWLDRIAKNEAAITDVIRDLEPVFPTAEAGFTGGPEEHNDDEAQYALAFGKKEN